MEIIQLLSSSVATGAGNAIPIDSTRLVNGAIPVLIHGVLGPVEAEIEIQGTIATQSEVNLGTCNWQTIEGGRFRGEIATSMIAPFSHIRSYVKSYTCGTISIRVGMSYGLMSVNPV